MCKGDVLIADLEDLEKLDASEIYPRRRISAKEILIRQKDGDGTAELSIQGDFTYRHHNEPRVQLHVPKEETFPFPLKHLDVTRSTHTDPGVLQEQRIDENVDSSSSDRKTCQRQRFKRQPDQIMYVQKFGRKFVKPLRIEKNRDGQKKNRSSTMLEDRGIYFIGPDDEEYKEIVKK